VLADEGQIVNWTRAVVVVPVTDIDRAAGRT
jgi:hypothetical protein